MFEYWKLTGMGRPLGCVSHKPKKVKEDSLWYKKPNVKNSKKSWHGIKLKSTNNCLLRKLSSI